MADVHDKKTRSYNMSQIKGKNTKPELLVRKFLFSHGFRYRLNEKDLPGKPDIVLPKYKTVIFVHGCFFHGHDNCKYFKFPEENSSFWVKKITATKARDIKKEEELIKLGWLVLSIWECELKPKKREETFNRLLLLLTKK